MRLTRGLPNGLFDNDAIASYLADFFSRLGLHRRLPQAPAQAVHRRHPTSTAASPRGRSERPESHHVPISEAVKASSALPGLDLRRASAIAIMSTAL